MECRDRCRVTGITAAFLIALGILAVTAGDTCGSTGLFPHKGDLQLPQGITVIPENTVTGIEEGDLFIPAGATLHLERNSTFIWNPGYSIYNEGQITFDTGAKLRKGYLCVQYDEQEGCWFGAACCDSPSCPGGFVRWKDVPIGTSKCSSFTFEGKLNPPLMDVPIFIDGAHLATSDSQGQFVLSVRGGEHELSTPSGEYKTSSWSYLADFQALRIRVDVRSDQEYVVCLGWGESVFSAGGAGNRGIRTASLDPFEVGVPGGQSEQIIALWIQDPVGVQEAHISVRATTEDWHELPTEIVTGSDTDGVWEARWTPPANATNPPSGGLTVRFFVRFKDGGSTDTGLFMNFYSERTGCGPFGDTPHSVSRPIAPTGPSSGQVDEVLTFSTGEATCSHKHAVEYQFDWGYLGEYSTWSTSTSASHAFPFVGEFWIRARARCTSNTSIVSQWSEAKPVTISAAPPSHTVSTPNTPTGPSSGQVGVSLDFSTGGSTCSQGHAVEYQLSWGDGAYSTWSSLTSASHSYSSAGTYQVKAHARCTQDTFVTSGWSSTKAVTISAAPPSHTVSTPDTPTGPSSGQVGESLTFSTAGSTCSQGHSVEYRFLWHDSYYSTWNSSGSASYTFTSPGTYQIKAQARCANDTSVVSNWSSGKSVLIEALGDTVPAWRQNIAPGDILYDPTFLGRTAGHVGIYIGHDSVIEAGKKEGVHETGITSWDERDEAVLLGVSAPYGVMQAAIDFALKQKGKPYDKNWTQKNSNPDSSSWYCSELVWAAYYNQGVNLEYTPDPYVVSPKELYNSTLTYFKGRHGEAEPGQGVEIRGGCPIDLIVTDPDGLLIAKEMNEIPGAIYIVDDLNDDDSPDSIVGISDPKRGSYRIEVIPVSGANPSDKYTLTVYNYSTGSETILVNEGSIANIPEHPYQIELEGDGSVPIPPSTAVRLGPNPVPAEGCGFWLDLPAGTSTAKLMIFNIAGRPVFETSLDVDSTRFPSVGTWNPVDQDGIPLANGPYSYVLIADGKVIGQGKMVIQR